MYLAFKIFGPSCALCFDAVAFPVTCFCIVVERVLHLIVSASSVPVLFVLFPAIVLSPAVLSIKLFVAVAFIAPVAPSVVHRSIIDLTTVVATIAVAAVIVILPPPIVTPRIVAPPSIANSVTIIACTAIFVFRTTGIVIVRAPEIVIVVATAMATAAVVTLAFVFVSSPPGLLITIAPTSRLMVAVTVFPLLSRFSCAFLPRLFVFDPVPRGVVPDTHSVWTSCKVVWGCRSVPHDECSRLSRMVYHCYRWRALS